MISHNIYFVVKEPVKYIRELRSKTVDGLLHIKKMRMRLKVGYVYGVQIKDSDPQLVVEMYTDNLRKNRHIELLNSKVDVITHMKDGKLIILPRR